ncbi:MAG: hypothetical protein KDC44_18360, partial [Phaeodactylibacter sp.]|nr:hypothetical protein [Phaeodactylibacter sp.]
MIFFNAIQADKATFSGDFLAKLECIAGGEAWLDWQLDNSADVFSSDSEVELLYQIQLGLHETPLINLPTRIRLSIEKLISLEAEEVQLLNNPEAEQGALDALCKKHGLVTFSDWNRQQEKMLSYLDQLGLADASLFAALSFEDVLVLYPFLIENQAAEGNPSGVVQKEIAQFALEFAGTIGEFIDLYRFGTQVAAEAGENEQLKAAMLDRYEDLLPLTNALVREHRLNPPSLTATADELSAVIKAALPYISFVGFATHAAAICNLNDNLVVSGSTLEEFKTRIEDYLFALKKELEEA